MTDSRDQHSTARLGWLAIVVLIATLVACRCIAIKCFPIYDDAFITYRYARNLARGLGLVYNPGASWEPVLGTTTPLYALVLALWVKLGVGVLHASLAFNLLCEAVAAYFLIHLLGRRSVASSVAIAAFAAIPTIGRITVGGMEPPFLVALALAAIWAAQRARPMLSGTLVALCCLVRPESLILVFALAWFHHRGRAKLVRFVVPIALIGVATSATLCVIYGKPIPQSIIAKASHTGLLARLAHVGDILSDAFGPIWPMRVCLPICAIGYLRGLGGGSKLRPLFVMALVTVTAYTLVGTKTWGWYFYVPMVVWVIALGLGSESIVERLGFLRAFARDSFFSRALPFALAPLVVASMIYANSAHPDRITRYVYQPLADWAKRSRLVERKVSVLASDIGAVGFFSNARILDSEGLVWPDALEYKHQVDIVRAFRPEYVLWVVKRERLDRFLADRELSACYRPIERFNERDDHDLHPTSFPPWWEQDYVIFERIDPPISE